MTIDIPKGYSIHGAAQRAVNEAQHKREDVSFEFNGLTIHVSRYSHPADIATIYDLKHELRRTQGFVT